MLERDYKIRKTSEEVLAELNVSKKKTDYFLLFEFSSEFKKLIFFYQIIKINPAKRTIKRPGQSKENFIEYKFF